MHSALGAAATKSPPGTGFNTAPRLAAGIPVHQPQSPLGDFVAAQPPFAPNAFGVTSSAPRLPSLPRRPRRAALTLAIVHDDGAALLAQELLDVVGAEATFAGRAAGFPAGEGLRARPG